MCSAFSMKNESPKMLRTNPFKYKDHIQVYNCVFYKLASSFRSEFYVSKIWHKHLHYY